MVKIVIGEKGEGKTKYLLDSANEVAKSSKGCPVYLDKNTKHMYELDKNIRLINVTEYCACSGTALESFIGGLIAGNSDIDVIYIDSFLTLAGCENDSADILAVLSSLKKVSDNNNVELVLSVSANADIVPAEFKDSVISL